MTVAALYVETGGVYFGDSSIEPWDATRDALGYEGPWPVVAHPPCSSWCQLAYVIEKRWGHKVGDDGGTFASALAAVRRFGGVLEHPAYSYAWARHGLPRPVGHATWSGTLLDPGWVAQVAQGSYGHPARKLTWLYYVSRTDDFPEVELRSEIPEPTAIVSNCTNHFVRDLPRILKAEAARTPPEFRDLLVTLAKAANSHGATDA